ncbi:MAG: hypothetical protein LUE92_16315 [Clostridiales bacterium]|nr:hypothetical protein [Clostridiales bacterium]
MDNIELPSIGVCMLAGVGCGMYQDAREAFKDLAGGVTVFEPNEENYLRYEQKLKKYRQYSTLYLSQE